MFIKTFMTILANHRLSEQRNPLGGQGKVGKWLIYLGYVYWAGIFLLMGSTLPSAFIETNPGTEPYHVLNRYLFYILLADYLLRWLQPMSVMSIQQYLTLPVKRSYVLHSFLVSKMLSWGNLFWNFFFLPFAIITITKFYGVTGVVGYLLGTTLLIVINSQWSLFVHMMKEIKLIYSILLPLPIYVGVILWNEFVPETWTLSNYTVDMGEGFIQWNLLYYLPLFLLMGLLHWLNLHVARKLCYIQPANASKKKKKAKSYKESKTESRELLRLEWKLIWRNKRPRQQFFFWIFTMLFFPLMRIIGGEEQGIAYMYIYTSYGIFFFGLAQLSTAIAYEGNYIDGLMVYKSYLNKILLAKYRLQCFFSAIGTLIGAIICYFGGLSIIYPISIFFFAIGPIYWSLMQCAVYNTDTLSLNGNMMNAGKKLNWMQTLYTLPAMMIYPILDALLQMAVEPTTSHIILGLVGISVAVFHKRWIEHIYDRFMVRKYERLEQLRKK